VFEDEKCVAVANRGNRVMMEVWSFSPPEDVYSDRPVSFPQAAEKEPAKSLNLDYRRSTLGLPSIIPTTDDEDVDMRDVAAATASTHTTTFFHDEEEQ
jgi:F-box and WD-40 domain protein CDC4